MNRFNSKNVFYSVSWIDPPKKDMALRGGSCHSWVLIQPEIKLPLKYSIFSLTVKNCVRCRTARWFSQKWKTLDNSDLRVIRTLRNCRFASGSNGEFPPQIPYPPMYPGECQIFWICNGINPSSEVMVLILLGGPTKLYSAEKRF